MDTSILKLSVVSRISVYVLQVVSNVIIPDHDAQVFQTIQPPKSAADEFIQILFSGFSRWDSQYFLHISHYGYTFENCLAFFPFYPLIVSIVRKLLAVFLDSYLNWFSLALVSGVLLNNFLFIASSQILFHFAITLFGDLLIAKLAVLFFCINPASIFFSSCYSESLFAFLTLLAFFFVENDRTFLGSIAVGLSCFTRSNGIVLIPYLCHRELKNFIKQFKYDSFVSASWIISIRLIRVTVYLIFALFPYIFYQVYSYQLFCDINFKNDIPDEIVTLASEQGYNLYKNQMKSSWCNWTIPYSYSYVQSEIWGVGFLHYYQLKQIPNFVLATPIILLSTFEIFSFVKNNSSSIMTLGLKDVRLGDSLFIYLGYLSGLLVTCLLYVHIQVTTRLLLSACPIIYCLLAARCRAEVKKLKMPLITIYDYLKCWMYLLKNSKYHYWCKYFVLYFMCGIIVHSNYLPWT